MQFPFSLPSRVSRLYPIFSIVLLLNSSVLFYVWQVDRIKLESFSTFEEREISLKTQIEQLLSAQKEDRSKLLLQNQKIEEATSQLSALQKQLETTGSELATKEAQLKTQQEQLKSQQEQLGKNASELEKLRERPPLFSFQNNSSAPNIAQQEAEAKQVVTDAYNYIQDIYGKPYLLNSIVITFVDSFSIPGSSGEIVIQNSAKGITININIKSFSRNNFQDVNTLIHEVIHGFHGIAVFETSALEEGIAVATTDAVMRNMIRDKKIPSFSPLYINIDEAQYHQWNNSLTVPGDNKALYSNPSVAKLYQLMGKAWYKLYEEDPTVFKKINDAYYPKVQQGLSPDNATVLNAIRSAVQSVDGQSIDTFLAANQAFNPR
jgi:myosin heavy subunit